MVERRRRTTSARNLAATSFFSTHLKIINDPFHAANFTRHLFSARLVSRGIYHTGQRYHAAVSFDSNLRELRDLAVVDILPRRFSHDRLTGTKAEQNPEYRQNSHIGPSLPG